MSTVEAGQADAPLILSIDIGTSSVRALLFDRIGRAVEGTTVRRTCEISATKEGAAEVDPDAMLRVVWTCIDNVLRRAGGLSDEIAGVAVCTFVTNILGVDDCGRSVTPLITYADTRSGDQVERLRTELDEGAVHQRTGCPFHTSYLPAQFCWLAQTSPKVFKRVARWISIGEYLEEQLFPTSRSGGEGETAVSYSVASWTGLLDRRKLGWDAPLLSHLPATIHQLSPLVDSDAPRRGLRNRLAERWPALSDAPWFRAIGDGAAANIGSGCLTPKRVAVTMGTTTAVRLVTAREVGHVPRGLWCYRVDKRLSLPGGALGVGGSLLTWMRQVLRLPNQSDLQGTLAAVEPDTHGLTLLPFLAGERSPGWAPDASATLQGLSLASTPLDILRAGMEAVAYRIALIFERLEPLLPADFQVIASGGALLNSPVWVQMVADVIGRPVVVSEVEEASARGAALLALKALGVLRELSHVPAFTGETRVPNVRCHDRYQRAKERQQALYDRLVGDQAG